MPKQLNEGLIVGDVLHAWRVKEFEQHTRGTAWFILAIILGLGLVLYGIFSGNFLFSLIIILFAIILFLQSHQGPQEVEFAITDSGVIVGRRFYSYSELEAFYIIYNPPHTKTLFFETSSAFRPILRIPLCDNNPLDVRHTLREFLSEDVEQEDEPWADTLVRNWKLH